MNKVLFICSDISVFDFPTKYALKDKFKVYCADENKEMKEEDKRKKINESNMLIIDVLNCKDDLKLINLAEYKKIAVLRHHESRNVSWCNNAILKCDAVCKYENRDCLKDIKTIDDLLKSLNAFNIQVEGDFKFYIKKGLRWLLFCLNASN